MNWLQKEARGKTILYLILGCIAFDISQSIVVVKILTLFQVNIPHRAQQLNIFTWYFPILLIEMAFVEEVIFRMPLSFFIERGANMPIILVASFVLSGIFGILHGNFVNLLIQGVGGFLYCMLFLKCGGLQRRYGKAIIVTTTTHLLFNSVVIGLIISHGGKKI